MLKITKVQVIVIVAIVIVVIGGLICWGVLQSKKLASNIENNLEPEYSMQGTVSSVNEKEGFLMVKPLDKTEEVKVSISETTKLIKISVPEVLPKGGVFTPVQTEIKISGFKAGDNIFIKTKEDIAGKVEFGSVDFIQIMP